MKKRYFFNLIALVFLFGISQLTSCRSTGVGCEGSEKYFNQGEGGEEAELSTKRGKSGLFSGKKKKKRRSSKR